MNKLVYAWLLLTLTAQAQPQAPDPSGLPRYSDDGVESVQSNQTGKTRPKLSLSEVDSSQQQTLSALAWRGQLPADLERVDQYARATPASAEATLEQLAHYLQGAGPDPIRRARAIYAWEAWRLTYDLKSPSPSPPDVLNNRRATCDGYARLFVALAQAMGLEAEHVLGYGKGGLVFVREDSRPNHRWVRVRVSNTPTQCWALIDPTWARPTRNATFLTDPREFLKSHWPSDAQWQLMTPPLSRRGWGFLGKKKGKNEPPR